jgi:hypothetical protein
MKGWRRVDCVDYRDIERFSLFEKLVCSWYLVYRVSGSPLSLPHGLITSKVWSHTNVIILITDISNSRNMIRGNA